MKERLIVYLRGSRIGFIISPRAVFDRLDALVETLPQKAQVLAEEMSDEGSPSPIYARIGEVIGEQAERVT